MWMVIGGEQAKSRPCLDGDWSRKGESRPCLDWRGVTSFVPYNAHVTCQNPKIGGGVRDVTRVTRE